MPTLSSQLLRSRIGKVCVAITGANAGDFIDRAAAAQRDTALLEFRLDYLSKPLAALPAFADFLRRNTALTAIATCRSKSSGGRFGGSVAAELDILTQAAASGFQLADLSLESAEAARPADLIRLRSSGVALILSYHDFKATRDLEGTHARMTKFAPDFFKIVPTARTLTDNLTLIRFIERLSDTADVIGIGMGEAGVISRVLGVRAGSAFTFAAAEPGEETAPGQLDARTLFSTYRIEEVDAATRVYGVAGNPVAHSLSPLMLNTAFRRETLNSVYLALQSADAADLLRLVHAIPIHGLSVTMPLKRELLPHLERMDPLSQKIGAVNTVVRTSEGKLLGFNTDVAGILIPLEKRLSLRGAHVLVLGAGGAARAAVFGLRDRGAEVTVSNRTHEAAQKLARQAHAKALRRELIAKNRFDVILNATPVGMSGYKPASPLAPNELNARLVFDLVYNPLETALLRMAREAGIPVITGVEMFVQQGARQFELWTGKQAPEEEMLRVVLHALRQHTDAGAGPLAAEKTEGAPSVPASESPTSDVEASSRPPASPRRSPALSQKLAPATVATSSAVRKAVAAAPSSRPARPKPSPARQKAPAGARTIARAGSARAVAPPKRKRAS